MSVNNANTRPYIGLFGALGEVMSMRTSAMCFSVEDLGLRVYGQVYGQGLGFGVCGYA